MIGVFFIIFITEIIILLTAYNIIKIIKYKKAMKEFNKKFKCINKEVKKTEEQEKKMKEIIDIVNKYKKEN